MVHVPPPLVYCRTRILYVRLQSFVQLIKIWCCSKYSQLIIVLFREFWVLFTIVFKSLSFYFHNYLFCLCDCNALFVTVFMIFFRNFQNKYDAICLVEQKRYTILKIAVLENDNGCGKCLQRERKSTVKVMGGSHSKFS